MYLLQTMRKRLRAVRDAAYEYDRLLSEEAIQRGERWAGGKALRRSAARYAEIGRACDAALAAAEAARRDLL